METYQSKTCISNCGYPYGRTAHQDRSVGAAADSGENDGRKIAVCKGKIRLGEDAFDV